MDGYAVRAADTFGASDSLPAYLRLVGEVPMGATTDLALQAGECALIHTGGMLPDQADAVVMVEHTQSARLGEVEIFHAAAVGENVIHKGEDVTQGEQVIGQGVRLRPQEIGGLMALGITQVRVFRRLRVGLISSGDEVIPPAQELLPGQVRDVNSYSLGALVEQNGAIPVQYGIVPDRAEALRATAKQALAECDLVLITAGSSASARDLTSQVISELGKPGVLVHGVSVRPGKPTILAVCDGKGGGWTAREPGQRHGDRHPAGRSGSAKAGGDFRRQPAGNGHGAIKPEPVFAGRAGGLGGCPAESHSCGLPGRSGLRQEQLDLHAGASRRAGAHPGCGYWLERG